jgi:hypothetical protein
MPPAITHQKKSRGAIRIALPAYSVQVWIDRDDHKRFPEFLQ